MKLSRIMLFFWLALPFCVILRFLQLYFTIEIETGFFDVNYAGYGKGLLILIFTVCLAAAFFAYLAHSRPEHPPKINLLLCISSILLCGVLLYEVIFENPPASVAFWQAALLKITGFSTALYFLLFGISYKARFKLPPLFCVFPVVYLISRIICDFTTISKLAFISDNIILMGAYIVTLLFMLNFAKLYNNVDSEKNFKKLLSCGVASIILSFTGSIPNIVFNLASGRYLHTPLLAAFSLLCFGIFILSFILSHFSKQNLND